MKLTRKQQAFCQEYLKDLNATQAAIRAGYSKKTAKVIGNENLTKPYISTHIARLLKKRSEKTEITSDNVLAEIAKIAFMKETDFYHEDGTPKLAHELTDTQRSGLKSYTVKTINTKDGDHIDIPIFTAHDKMKALEMAARHLGMFNDKLKVEGEFNLEHFVKKIHDEGD